MLAIAALLPAASAQQPPAAWPLCDVTSFGAKGDNATLNTAAFRSAIRACEGGGVVLVPYRSTSLSIFITGPVNLTSNIALEVQKGATMVGVGYDTLSLPPLPSMGGTVAAGGGGGAGLPCRESPLIGACKTIAA